MKLDRPLLLIGAGNMGGAMLDGWLASGIAPGDIHVVDPAPSPENSTLSHPELNVAGTVPDVKAGTIIIAVKPHLVEGVLPDLAHTVDGETLVVSIAAGTTLDTLAQSGAKAIVRAMPNTPASVGEAAIVGVATGASESQKELAHTLLSAVGQMWWVEDEALLDAVTAVSGSGPAYVFHLTEALAKAGETAGLPPDLAQAIARQTVVGAGALLSRSPLDPGTLRENVTSKGGTTAAALKVLHETGAMTALMTEAVDAAAKRSRELGS